MSVHRTQGPRYFLVLLVWRQPAWSDLPGYSAKLSQLCEASGGQPPQAASALLGKLLVRVHLVHHGQVSIRWVLAGRIQLAKESVIGLQHREVLEKSSSTLLQPREGERTGNTRTARVLPADRDQEKAEPREAELVS